MIVRASILRAAWRRLWRAPFCDPWTSERLQTQEQADYLHLVDGGTGLTVPLDRYGHLYEGLDGQIADRLDDVLVNACGHTAASTEV